MPRVMRKPLRAHFHNFDHNFVALTSLEPSHRTFCVIGNERTFGQIPRVIGIDLRADFDNFFINLTPSN